MTTQVRDAIVEHFSKSDGKYFTADEIAEKLKVNESSAYGAMFTLAARAILAKRRRDGSKQVEFAIGKRIEVGKKYAGRKLPFHRKAPTSDALQALPPGTVSSVGIIMKVDGQAHAITLSQAKAIYLELKMLFG